MSVTVPNSCPYYRYKPKEDKVTTCDGDVIDYLLDARGYDTEFFERIREKVVE